MVKMSRRQPPIPVAEASKGSTAEGWLWDSILNATPIPSPMSTTPVFSSPAPTSTCLPVVGNNLKSFREFL